MTRTFIRFQDVNAPLELVGCDALTATIRAVLPYWPASISDHAPPARPFFRIEPNDEKPGRFLCHNIVEGNPPRSLDGVNAICDMIAALSVALPESDPRILCLHAAAVDIGGRLVLFPNARRAGKSTLTAALARHGVRVFTDDFLPVRYDTEGRLVGRANGIAPRVRLPLPKALDPALSAWVTEQDGPANRQYKYLSNATLARAGDTVPLGGIVLLDRQEAGATQLAPISPDRAMDILLKQNFTRDRHSADILTLMARLLGTLKPQRLTYSDAADGARAVLAQFARWPDPEPRHPEPATPDLSKADLTVGQGLPLEADRAYVQRPGAAIARLGDALYLADPDGSGIHRLNDVSAAIWTMLQDPLQPEDVIAVLTVAFPDADPLVIASDTLGFLNRLARAGLIAPWG